jgi:hypothetical protein
MLISTSRRGADPQSSSRNVEGRRCIWSCAGISEVFRRLAEQKESKILEGHLMPGHLHMLISIAPMYAMSQVVGFIKGKSAIHLARVYGERKRNFISQDFWAKALLRQYSRPGRASDTGVHPQPREGGSEVGATQPLAMTPSGVTNLWGRVSDPICRLGRLQS